MAVVCFQSLAIGFIIIVVVPIHGWGAEEGGLTVPVPGQLAPCLAACLRGVVQTGRTTVPVPGQAAPCHKAKLASVSAWGCADWQSHSTSGRWHACRSERSGHLCFEHLKCVDKPSTTAGTPELCRMGAGASVAPQARPGPSNLPMLTSARCMVRW
jgi:hypothetical protein